MAVFTDELCDEIFNTLANSQTGLDTICKQKGIPASTFREYVLSNESISANYAHARKMQIENIECEIQDCNNKLISDIESGKIAPEYVSAMVTATKNKCDNLKWILSKLVPKKYGDKLDVTSDNKTVNVALSAHDAQAIADRLKNEI